MKKIAVASRVLFLGLLVCCVLPAFSQTLSSLPGKPVATVAPVIDVPRMMHPDPWERGVFLDGGYGVTIQPYVRFLNAGVRLGKVLTGAYGPGVLRGQFEYAVEVMPYWQSFRPEQVVSVTTGNPPQTHSYNTGGTYTGLSVTPIILRWNFVHWRRVMPWAQGAGGLIWTNHKYPQIGTSVWNFSPQFGVGIHYFVKPKQAITFAANAEHVSSASLGDKNPGVNASVQFQVGYTWWK